MTALTSWPWRWMRTGEGTQASASGRTAITSPFVLPLENVHIEPLARQVNRRYNMRGVLPVLGCIDDQLVNRWGSLS